MQVNIYKSDQAKSFQLREFTRELTQPNKHLFFKPGARRPVAGARLVS